MAKGKTVGMEMPPELSELELVLLCFHSLDSKRNPPTENEVYWARRRLFDLGLIKYPEGEEAEDDVLTTDRGEAHLDHLLNIELPNQRWTHGD